MKRVLRNMGCLLCSGFLYAGPPMMTDDPFVPEVNEVEMNLAMELEKGADLHVVAPIIDLNYGIYPNVQFTVETAYASSDKQYQSDGVEMAIKYHFYRSERINIALYPKYFFYPIETVFNEGESYEFQIPISLQLSDSLEWVTSLSYLFPQKEENRYEIGMYLAYEKSKHTYYLESYLEENPKDKNIATFFNVGYFYQYQDNLGLMASFGIEEVESSKQADVAYLGLQFIF